MTNIIIGSPHSRNLDLVEKVKKNIPDTNIIYVRSPEELLATNLKEFSPDWIFFPHWSWKISSEIYDSYECVIFHMTDLPFGRGGTPLQNLITKGFKSTKICALRCEEGIDTGPVYCRKPLSLEGTAEEILGRANLCIEEMISEIVLSNLRATPQVGEVVLFERRSPNQSNIADLESLNDIYDHIRMLDGEGYPPAYLSTSSHRYAFSDVRWEQDALVATVRIKEKRI